MALPVAPSTARLFPLSLSVRESGNQPIASSSSIPSPQSARQRDLVALRDSERAKKEFESLTTRWSDLLMESDSVKREVLRKAANHLQPSHYQEITHERHLNECCSYPTCANSPKRPYSDTPRFRLTRNRNGRSRDVEEVTGNPDDGYCSPKCRARSIWYERNLSEEPVWARAQTSAVAGQEEGGEIAMTMLEDLEDRKEIVWTRKGEMKMIKPKVQPEDLSAVDKAAASSSSASSGPSPMSTKTEPIRSTAGASDHKSGPKPSTSKNDKPLTTFSSNMLDSLRVIERPTVATTLGKQGLAGMGPDEVPLPEPPSLERAKVLQDELGMKGSKGWIDPKPKPSAQGLRTGPSMPSPSSNPKAKPRPRSNTVTQARLLSARRREYDSSASNVSSTLLNLPQDADNVADFSRVIAGASKAGLESAKGRERVSGAFNGGAGGRVFGGAMKEGNERDEGDGDQEEEEVELDEDEEDSEEEDMKLAFEQAELAQQQLNDGTFH